MPVPIRPDSIVARVVRSLFELESPPGPDEIQSAYRSLQSEGLWGLALQRCSQVHGNLSDTMKSDFMACIIWEMRCLAVLKELSTRTEGLGIPIVTFKGCSLAFSGGYRPGQRAFGDIDLAIPKAGKEKLVMILRELGYFVGERQGEALREGIYLDLHNHPLHQLAGALENDPDSWFREAVPLDPRSGKVLRLHFRHEFILSLFHGAKHAFSRVNWLVDLVILMNQQNPAVLAQAVQHYRAQRHLWLAGECLKHWFDMDLPQALKQACAPPRVWDPVTPFILKRILARTAPDYLGMLTPLWATRGLHKKLRYLQKTLFPDNIGFRARIRQLLKMALELRSEQAKRDS
ncbi:nucleotidyltransferase family protein [bacterium]|nr:nucleotidyltransferase family protein [bacterium]